MLSSRYFDAFAWAQRYAINYQQYHQYREGIEFISPGITQCFMQEARKWIPYMSNLQAARQCSDISMYITDQERLANFDDTPLDYTESPLKESYELEKLLVSHTEKSSDPVQEEPDELDLFKMVYYAMEYCITRHSYAAGYYRDIIPMLPKFTEEELRYLHQQLETRLMEQEARAKQVDSDIIPACCESGWYSLKDAIQNYLNAK